MPRLEGGEEFLPGLLESLRRCCLGVVTSGWGRSQPRGVAAAALGELLRHP